MVPLTCPVPPCLSLGLELISVSQRRSHLPKHRPHTHTFVRQWDACQAHLEEYVREVRRNRQSVGWKETWRGAEMAFQRENVMVDFKEEVNGLCGTERAQKLSL